MVAKAGRQDSLGEPGVEALDRACTRELSDFNCVLYVFRYHFMHQRGRNRGWSCDARAMFDHSGFERTQLYDSQLYDSIETRSNVSAKPPTITISPGLRRTHCYSCVSS